MRAAIGVTGQFAAVDELLTGRENLRLMADLKRVRSAGQVVTGLLERFDLTEPADKLASTYSGGMRRKLDLAMTLVGSPRIIFLDEPTTGLDPRSRRTMREIVRELVADGTTIFLTTQYLEEADQLGRPDRGARPGPPGRPGQPGGAEAPDPRQSRPAPVHQRPRLDAAARLLAGATRDDENLTLRVPGDGGVKSLQALLGLLTDHSVDAEELSVHTPDLDDVFLALTGRANMEVNA